VYSREPAPHDSFISSIHDKGARVNSMQSSALSHRNFSRLLLWIALGGLFLFAGSALVFVAMSLTSRIEPGPLVIYFGCAALLLVFAYVSISITKSRAYTSDAVIFSVLRVLWLVLLIDDIIFNFGRSNALSSELQGNFTSAAYGEVLLWVISAAILTVVSFSKITELLAAFFVGARKWMTLFLLLCIGSTAYSVSPAYSLGWSFKLALDVWMVVLFSLCIRDESRIFALLRTTALSIGIVMVMALVQLAIDPAGSFVEGRLAGIAFPTVLSELGGLLLLLSLIFFRYERAGWSIPAAVLGSVVMFLGGGKIAICAAMFGVGMFFLLQRKGRTAVLVVGSLLLLAFGILLIAPTGSYFAHYASTGQAATLTGRVELWKAEWPEIQSHILIGHGYLASRFVPAPFKEGGWQVGSLHSVYLDVLFNLGLPGLFVLLMMNYWMIRNFRYLRKRASTPALFILTNGLLAIYIDLLVNSPFAVPFGSRPYTFFMVFLAIFAITTRLRESQESSPVYNFAHIKITEPLQS
jgi:O-antigen ligase